MTRDEQDRLPAEADAARSRNALLQMPGRQTMGFDCRELAPSTSGRD